MDERLLALESDLASLRGEVTRLRRRKGNGRWRIVLAAAIIVALALAPLGVLGANFIDLNPNSLHNGNINAIADAGISRGCGDTAHYCPNNLVTREEMASFLARTAGLGGNPPVTNAALLGGWPAHALVRTNATGNGNNVVAVGNTYQTVTSAAMNVPAPGFVHVVGAVNVYAGQGNSSAYVSVRLRDVASGLSSYSLNAYVGTSTGHSYETSFSPTIVFPASAGSRTYVLEVGRDSTAFGPTGAWHGTLTLIYVPFGPGGFQAASVDGAQLAEPGDLTTPEASPADRPRP